MSMHVVVVTNHPMYQIKISCNSFHNLISHQYRILAYLPTQLDNTLHYLYIIYTLVILC